MLHLVRIIPLELTNMESIKWQRTYYPNDPRIASTLSRLDKRNIEYKCHRPYGPFKKFALITIVADQYTYKQERFLKHLNFEENKDGKI